jgi:hypothetical protein
MGGGKCTTNFKRKVSEFERRKVKILEAYNEKQREEGEGN